MGGTVDHHAGKAQPQRFHADGEAVAVVQMDGHRNVHLIGAPFGHLHKEVVAGVGAGGDVMGQDNGAAQVLGSLAAGPDDIVVAALGVDGRDGKPFPGGPPQQVEIVGKHGVFLLITRDCAPSKRGLTAGFRSCLRRACPQIRADRAAALRSARWSGRESDRGS